MSLLQIKRLGRLSLSYLFGLFHLFILGRALLFISLRFVIRLVVILILSFWLLNPVRRLQQISNRLFLVLFFLFLRGLLLLFESLIGEFAFLLIVFDFHVVMFLDLNLLWLRNLLFWDDLLFLLFYLDRVSLRLQVLLQVVSLLVNELDVTFSKILVGGVMLQELHFGGVEPYLVFIIISSFYLLVELNQRLWELI